MPGRHRRVGGEHRRVADVLEGLLRPEPVPLDQMSRPREKQEGAVPLVHVEYVRLDVELGEQLIAAKAQDHLLSEAVRGVPAVGDR